MKFVEWAVEKINRMEADWLREFDNVMLGYFEIDLVEAGMDEGELSWCADLPAKDAALAYGQDFDLCRTDDLSPAPGIALIRNRKNTAIK